MQNGECKMQNWNFLDISNCLHSEFCILNWGVSSAREGCERCGSAVDIESGGCSKVH